MNDRMYEAAVKRALSPGRDDNQAADLERLAKTTLENLKAQDETIAALTRRLETLDQRVAALENR